MVWLCTSLFMCKFGYVQVQISPYTGRGVTPKTTEAPHFKFISNYHSPGGHTAHIATNKYTFIQKRNLYLNLSRLSKNLINLLTTLEVDVIQLHSVAIKHSLEILFWAKTEIHLLLSII